MPGTVLCAGNIEGYDGPRPALMTLTIMVKCKFPIILIVHRNFSLLNDSIGYRNVMMFYEDGKFWIDGR